MDGTTASSTATLSPARRPARLLRLLGDERLVAELRRGSEPAFEVLYDRYHRGVLGFSRHMLGSLEEAEDAVQHTFMAAYRDLVGSDKAIQLKPWLYTIARNRCLTMLRARREQPSDDLDSISTEGLADEVQRREDLRALVRDVGALPEDQRAALVLAEVGDVSHDEIAAVLGCETAKVKALVFQARSSLAASRQARDTPCEEIREQLANLRGGSLRRNSLRRHLRECAGCTAFKQEMETQRRCLALALPVVPALGFKESVLAAILGGGGGAAGGGAVLAGGGAAGGMGALIAKALVVLAVAGGGSAAGVAALGDDAVPNAGAPAARSSVPQGPSGGDGLGSTPLIAAAPAARRSRGAARSSAQRPAVRRKRVARKHRAERRAQARRRARREAARSVPTATSPATSGGGRKGSKGSKGVGGNGNGRALGRSKPNKVTPNGNNGHLGPTAKAKRPAAAAPKPNANPKPAAPQPAPTPKAKAAPKPKAEAPAPVDGVKDRVKDVTDHLPKGK